MIDDEAFAEQLLHRYQQPDGPDKATYAVALAVMKLANALYSIEASLNEGDTSVLVRFGEPIEVTGGDANQPLHVVGCVDISQ